MAAHANSTTVPTRPLLPLPALDRRAIGRDGWARARELAARLGGEIRDHLAAGLRQAWRAAQDVVRPADVATVEPVELPPEPLLPAPAALPSLSAALSRRRAIFGAVTLATVPAAAMPVLARGLHPVDAHLVELADEIEAIHHEAEAHIIAHREIETEETEREFSELCGRYSPVEEELATTAAISMVGALAKARALQVPTLREEDSFGIGTSLADDLVKLHAGRVLA